MVSATADRVRDESVRLPAAGDEREGIDVTDLTIERYRQLAEELRALVGQRKQLERELVALEEDEDAPSRHQLDQEIEALEQQLRADTAAADERLAAAVQEIDARFRSDAATIERD